VLCPVSIRSGKYRGYLVLAIIAILLITVGLPVGVAQLLFANRGCVFVCLRSADGAAGCGPSLCD
jgi:hypothetical protein